MLSKKGEHDRAEPELAAAIEVFTRVWGRDAWNTKSAREQLYEHFVRAGQTDRCEAWLRTELGYCVEREGGPRGVDSVMARTRLADFLIQGGRPADGGIEFAPVAGLEDAAEFGPHIRAFISLVRGRLASADGRGADAIEAWKKAAATGRAAGPAGEWVVRTAEALIAPSVPPGTP
jgi:hypothetical protein